MFLLLSLLTIFTGFSFSQNVNLFTVDSEKKDEPKLDLKDLKKAIASDGDQPANKETKISFPVGVTAGLKTNKSDEPVNRGAIVGLQLGIKDNYFISALFNYSGSKKIAGEQSSFGAFLLNPSSEGSSFTFSGNKLWTIKDSKILLGLSVRTGVSFTDWEVTNSEGTETHNGSLFYSVPSVILVTKTNGKSESKFQFGLEVGLGFRKIMGDLSQADEFISKDEVLGVSRTSFIGFEATFFLKLNDVRPFLRITIYPEKYGIKGFSGWQAYLGFDLLSPLFKASL